MAALISQDSKPASGVVRICEVLRDYYVYADTREPVLDENGEPVWAGWPYRGDCMEFPRRPNNWPTKDKHGYSGGVQRVLDEYKLRTQCRDCNSEARDAVAEMEEHHNQCIDSATAIADRKCSNGYQIGEPKGNPVPREEVKCDSSLGIIIRCKRSTYKWDNCVKGWLNGATETVNGSSTDGSISAGELVTLTYNGEQRSTSFGPQGGIGQRCNQWQADEYDGINRGLARCIRNVNIQASRSHSEYHCKPERVAQ